MVQINARSAGLASLIVVPVATAGVYLFNQPKPSPAYAVCLTTPIAFEDGQASGCYMPDQVQALATRPVSFGENEGVTGLQMSSASAGMQSREVHSCAEYAAAQRDGLAALSTFDMSIESFFKEACGTLQAIAAAKPAQRSYLSSPHVSLGDLNLLPTTAVSMIVTTPAPARTLGDLVSAGGVTVSKKDANTLEIQAGATAGQLKEIARGDFNGDGLEDILAFQAVHAEDGTFRAYDTEILTRRSAEGPLEVTR